MTNGTKPVDWGWKRRGEKERGITGGLTVSSDCSGTTAKKHFQLMIRKESVQPGRIVTYRGLEGKKTDRKNDKG